MKVEMHLAPERTGPRAGRLAALVAGLAVLGLLAAYWSTAQSIESIWRRSETFAHGYVVVPIVLWLIWRKRDSLATISPQPFWPALGLVAAAGFGWLLGSLAGVLVLEQFALLFMLVGTVIAVVGLPIARTIAFPLAFLVFAIPFGEFLVPLLIDRTADVTIAALRASSIPVYREGNHFVIPTGRWSVVEACSGIRYLIASAVAGTLYAYLTYRSARRRAIFIAASLAVPIVANWARAYLIVMLGHLSNNKIAAGVDHLVYGWVFFGIVILGMFWVGSYWREDTEKRAETAQSARTDSAKTSPIGVSPRPVALALIAALAVGIGWRPLAFALEARGNDPVAPLATIQAVSGWTSAAAQEPIWTPRFVGANTETQQWFAKDGARVGVYVAAYSGQSEGRELVSSQNTLVTPEDSRWAKTAEGRRTLDWSGASITVRTADLTSGSVQLTTRSWYWIDGRFTSSDAVAKGLLALTRITLRPDHSAVIVIYTDRTEPPARADAVLDQFAREMGAAVMASLLQATPG